MLLNILLISIGIFIISSFFTLLSEFSSGIIGLILFFIFSIATILSLIAIFVSVIGLGFMGVSSLCEMLTKANQR
ncbi:Uncharacterised protein [Mycoplasmopsis columboralis]|uniref:Uncharacterized protein n=1 Tax=Mycoplasmopsis columboralis TaxID=171282 RepID=A0A449B6K4_9BACT|nr:Uncharacterised protein [Mycoplasmopsis columboralis]VEU76241.1 Uncharacterised protein [Mycoplasmopsis columboralis]